MNTRGLLFIALLVTIGAEAFGNQSTGAESCKSLLEKLIEHDSQAWLNLVDDLTLPFQDGVVLVENQDVVSALRCAPYSLKREIEEKVLAKRAIAYKENHYGTGAQFPPRRTMDLILTILWNPNEAFQNCADPLVAARGYFNHVQEAFDGKASVYPPEAVFALALEFQKVLQVEAREENSPEITIEIFGSFPNGKSLLGISDVDIRVEPKWATHRIQTSLQHSAQSVMRKFKLSTGSPVVAQYGGDSPPLSRYSIPNPLTLWVSSNEANLVVFPLPHSVKTDPATNRLLGEWREPAIFPLTEDMARIPR